MVGQRLFLAIARASAWMRDACFPLACVGCRATGVLWCAACRARFTPRHEQHCPACETPGLWGRPCEVHRQDVLNGVIAAGWYAEKQLQRLLKLWKYNSVREAEPFVQSVLEQWGRRPSLFPSGSWTLVPLALHPRRARARGFDQSVILTRIVSSILELPASFDLLTRTRANGKPQADIKRLDARLRRNFSGVFSVAPNREIPSDIILVDDVYTTGTTARAAATALKAAGAKRVWVLTLLRGH